MRIYIVYVYTIVWVYSIVSIFYCVSIYIVYVYQVYLKYKKILFDNVALNKAYIDQCILYMFFYNITHTEYSKLFILE